MNKNKKHSNRKRSIYPSQAARLDDILIAEVRMALQLNIPEDIIVNNYGISYSQLSYCKKKKLSFKDIYKEEYNND